jgi:hypothetical protein
MPLLDMSLLIHEMTINVVHFKKTISELYWNNFSFTGIHKDITSRYNRALDIYNPSKFISSKLIKKKLV